MHHQIDFNDPLATAAAAMGAARKSAALLRGSLPALLHERSQSAFGLLANRLEDGRILDAWCRHALATLVARCEHAIARGTTEATELEQTGWGPDGPVYTPERVLVRTSEAEQALEVYRVLRTALDLADRTRDLVAAEAAVMNLRS